MSKTTRHLIIQAFLIAIWVLILISTDITVPVLSQTQQGCPQPPFWNPPPTNSWSNYGWPVVKLIDVKIDVAWDKPEREAIEAGVSRWNVAANCSNVRFRDFSTIIIEDYEEAPPDNTVYWQRTDPQNNGFLGATRNHHSADLRVRASRIQIMPSVTNQSAPEYFAYLGSHETGHTFNLGHHSTSIGSIMGGHFSDAALNLHGPFECDFFKANQQYPCGVPTPSPSPSPTPTPNWPWPDPYPPTDPETCENGGWFWNFSNSTCNPDPADATCGSTRCAPYVIPLDGGDCNSADDYCALPYGCPPGTVDGGRGCCCFPTPVLIDVSGNGFSLTDAYNGVMFDMGGDGKKEPVAWTTIDNDDAWLVLDRNGNGQIDSAKEMFGNFTDQPHATTRLNGFVALAEFDRNDNGGNGDGKINSADSVFANLKLWQDKNRNGVSEQGELHTLTALNISTLELDYKESKKSDANGNRFSYRAKVKDAQGNQIGRWAWDVTLSANPPRRP
jgi:hypothetical protein